MLSDFHRDSEDSIESELEAVAKERAVAVKPNLDKVNRESTLEFITSKTTVTPKRKARAKRPDAPVKVWKMTEADYARLDQLKSNVYKPSPSREWRIGKEEKVSGSVYRPEQLTNTKPIRTPFDHSKVKLSALERVQIRNAGGSIRKVTEFFQATHKA